MHRAGLEHRAAEAFLRLPNDGEDNGDLNDALPGLTNVPSNKAKETDGIGPKHHILSNELNAIAPGLPTVSKIATT